MRRDLLIAICALLISSFASAASWWQARLLGEQTTVLRQQLGAQVWPYAEVSEALDYDAVTIKLTNNGLGPAILRSMVVSVDGARKSSLTDVLHAILGPNLVARKPHGESMALFEDQDSPGTALRPGDSTSLLVFKSKTFARRFILANQRINFRVCYCAILPGQCWFSDAGPDNDRQPVASCPEIRDDLMHVPVTDALRGRF